MSIKNPLMSIGQISKRTGISVSKVRFYADEALLPTHRGASGQRLFNRSTIRRVSFILIAQKLGYSLKEIRAALESLPEQRTPTKADWEKLSRRFNRDIEEKIQALETLKNTLTSCIGCGCLSLKSCKLYNPEDKIAQRGTGPRYLLGDSAKDLD